MCVLYANEAFLSLPELSLSDNEKRSLSIAIGLT